MQVDSPRRSNDLRTAEMRARLMDAARSLFVAHGFAGTSTPAIVDRAGVTRGALYHHFPDKTAIFRAVLEREAAEVAAAILAADPPGANPLDALLAGASAYLAAMAVPGRTRLLLVDGPAALGRVALRQIEAQHGDATLLGGVKAAQADGTLPPLPAQALTSLLSAMFERAALDLSDGHPPADYLATAKAIILGLSQLRQPH